MPRTISWVALGALSLVVSLARLGAQDAWSPVSVAAGQNLWGACYGGGQFVAVGEAGTVLTSADGLAWTPRSAGNTSWLLAVTYSSDLQRYVIVGDQGLVLTSPDAITWTARTSGTTQRLNGIASGGGRLLAVGEFGTTCTSTDGVTWSAHTIAGAPGWLRGVAFGAGRFVICGQALTQSATQQQATTWTTVDGAQFDGTIAFTDTVTLAFEALAFDGSQFVLAGQHVALAPATFPLNWHAQLYQVPSLSSPPFRYFRGAAFFNGTWVAVGNISGGFAAQTPIVYGYPTATGAPWKDATGIATSASLNAIAASPGVAVAVGTGGGVWRSTATQSAPEPFLLSPSGTIVAATGSTVQLSAGARGAPPLTFQWNFNGRPIANATQPTLTLTNLQSAQSGTYTLAATNAFGTATSSADFLTVVSPLSIVAPVDPNFITPLTGVPGPFAVQADGKVIVNAPVTNITVSGQPRFDLVRLYLDGSIDPTFHPTTGAVVSGIEVASDGHILLAAPNFTSNSTNLLRLNADGTTDTTFATTRIPATHVVLADGRFFGAVVSQNSLALSRFNPDGAADASYSVAPITLGPNPPGPFDATYSSAFFAKIPGGKIMLVATAFVQIGTGSFFTDESTLIRLNADGTIDPTFTTAKTTTPIVQLVAVGDKFYFRYATRSGPLGSVAVAGIGRLTATGAFDPAYASRDFSSSIAAPLLQLASDGGYFYLPPDSRVLSHYNADGSRDAEFSARFATNVAFTQLVPIDGGRLLVAGAFTNLNGSAASYLARLTPDTRASATRLTNLSIRQLAGTGSQTLIVGLVLAGSGSKTLVLRGIGPALAQFGVPAPLADPRLAVFNSTGGQLLANDNWSDNADAAGLAATSAAAGAFALPAGSKDAATLATLPAGAFTMAIGFDGAGAIALAEGYDTGGTPPDYTAARVVNFSARANAGLGSTSLIAGFTISGPNVKRVLLRAVGPGLNQFGVTATLATPQLTLFSGQTAIASNAGWTTGNGSSDLSAAFAATGAFPLSSTSNDAALLITLPPGNYTAQVTDAAGAVSGVALVEVYEVP